MTLGQKSFLTCSRSTCIATLRPQSTSTMICYRRYSSSTVGREKSKTAKPQPPWIQTNKTLTWRIPMGNSGKKKTTVQLKVILKATSVLWLWKTDRISLSICVKLRMCSTCSTKHFESAASTTSSILSRQFWIIQRSSWRNHFPTVFCPLKPIELFWTNEWCLGWRRYCWLHKTSHNWTWHLMIKSTQNHIRWTSSTKSPKSLYLKTQTMSIAIRTGLSTSSPNWMSIPSQIQKSCMR